MKIKEEQQQASLTLRRFIQLKMQKKRRIILQQLNTTNGLM
jgi:hypothetical protein